MGWVVTGMSLHGVGCDCMKWVVTAWGGLSLYEVLHGVGCHCMKWVVTAWGGLSLYEVLRGVGCHCMRCCMGWVVTA